MKAGGENPKTMPSLEELERRIAVIERRPPPAHTGVQKCIWDKEHDRLLAERTSLRNAYAGHQSWDPKDRARLNWIKGRIEELRPLLNIKA